MIICARLSSSRRTRLRFLIIGEGRAVWSMWWIDDEIFMKSVMQGLVHPSFTLVIGGRLPLGARWRTDPRGDRNGHWRSSLWVMIYQPGVFKALLILLSIMPPLRLPSPGPSEHWSSTFNLERVFLGDDSTLMLQIRAAPAQMGSPSLSFALHEWRLFKRNGNTVYGNENVPNN